MMNYRWKNIALYFLTIFLCFVASLQAQQPSRAELEKLEEAAFRQAAALVNPSIVRIETVGGLDRVGEVLTGTGPTTGVAVSEDGYIISSAFNFISNPASILVTLPDGRRFPAEQVATDHSRMLTLLKIDTNDLTPPQVAPREEFRVGQWALALGRTYSNDFPNLSVGIVSALNRIWGKAIQTDAKVSPVNYGGPLVDIQGRVMGILVPLSANKSGETAGFEWYDSGIGFAIPLEDIYDSLDQLKSGEDLHQGLAGITLKGRNQLFGKPVIDRVRVGSPAEEAGLKPGDRITQINGQKIDRQAQLKQALGNKYADESITISVQREDETVQSELTLVAELQPYESGFLGILPTRERNDEVSSAGVGVRFVYSDSPAKQIGLQRRDRIIGFNGEEVTDSAQLTDLVSRFRPKEKTSLTYLRQDEEKNAEVELSSIPNSVPQNLNSAPIPAFQRDEDEELQTGRFTKQMPAHEHSYWAYVPEDYNPRHRYGLMVWIHPDGDTMEAAVYQKWKAICDLRGMMLLAPKAEQISGWKVNEAEFVKDAVEQFTEDYPIDRTRIFLHSFSNGGQFAYRLAFKYRELFRGIANVATPLKQRPPENHPDYRFQFYLSCGDADDLFPQVKATAQALQKLKYPAVFRKIEGHDHSYPSVIQIEEVGRWADSLDRI